MNTLSIRSSRRPVGGAWRAGLVLLALLATACSSSSTATSPSSSSSSATVKTTSPAASTANSSADTAAPGSPAPGNPSSAFSSLIPPTGKEMVIGLVNTEGTPGLDFPEIRIDIQAAVDYLNQHGGMGGRPIKIENCTVKGSPETSQACAQQLVGKHVEMVLLGLDVFPDYATYTAAKIPVVGVLPILPGDYTANALFLTGGNATTTGAMTAAAKQHYKAKKVGIVSADNPGANGTEAALTASLDLAGIAHYTVKGGDNETDAGYQGLMREAAKQNPDLLVSLYSDDGCIGTIRGRAALGIKIPAITTAICAGSAVLKQVGDDALGWSFVGVSTQQKDTPELSIVQAILAPALGVAPKDVDATALGLGALGLIEIMSLAEYADIMNAKGTATTGASLYSFLGSSKDLTQWPSGSTVQCGAAAKYPSICSLTFPISEYVAGGSIKTIAGLEAVSVLAYLP